MVVGFIGAGNMAAAMARGWHGSSPRPSRMLFTDSGSGRARALAEEVGGRAVASNEELVRDSDFVVLAVKPAALDEVAASLPAPRAVLSLLGATPLERLTTDFPDSAVLRLMPNLGVEVRRGVICVATPEGIDPGIAEKARSLLAGIAEVFELPDAEMDVATALMGCSPAYFAVAAQAMIAEAVDGGIKPDLAVRMLAESLAGTGELLRHRSPFEIQVAVASPGGSTEAGLDALAKEGGEAAFRAAFAASLVRMRGG